MSTLYLLPPKSGSPPSSKERENRGKQGKGNTTVIGQVLLLLLCPGLLGNWPRLVIPVDTQGNECQTSPHSHAVGPVYGPRAGLGSCCSTTLAGASPRRACCPLGLSRGFLSPTLAKVPLTFAFNKRKLGMFPPNRLNILSKIAC